MEEVKFLGLPMGSRRKKLTIGLMILAFVLILVYIICCFVYEPPVDGVELPSGNLVQNIFEAQNMTYQGNASLTGRYVFQNAPYSIDVPAGVRASVGDAMVLSINGLYFLYSEGKDGLEAVLKDGYTSVVSMQEKESDITVLSQETGYIHGCYAEFMVCRLDVAGAEPYYICAYRLEPTAEDRQIDGYLYVACMTNGYNTANLANLAALCNVSVESLSYNAKAVK